METSARPVCLVPSLNSSVFGSLHADIIFPYDYKYDEIGRRGSVTNSGTAFDTAAFNLYDYNDRSELTGSHRYEGTDIGNLEDPLGSETRIYAYDPIGNRKSATEGTADIAYASNSLNQYTAISGISPAYDDDGNMLSDAERNYTWNAENRLVLEEPVNPADGKKAEFLYDYMGRRVRKTVFAYAAGTWTQESEKLFVYDGWNLIEEIADQGGAESSKYYVWGLDLSQSLQGAGGIGGLICSVDNTGNTLYYLYDGNGNVGQLAAGDGGIAAHYEYDPFGNQLLADGPEAENNPFRFSTKYYDVETGLYYYGFRYYSPELGRWLNIDPIRENGGFNLYNFVNNNPIEYIDKYGLATCKVKEFSLEVVEWIIEFPQKQYCFFNTDKYTIALVVDFNLELDPCCNKNDCNIRQYKTGMNIRGEATGQINQRGYDYGRIPDIFDKERDGEGWTGGDEALYTIMASSSWLGLSWNFWGNKAAFNDSPGFYDVSANEFPLYRGSKDGKGFFVFNTQITDNKTNKIVSELEWKMLIDYKSPSEGKHDSDPKVGKRLVAK